MRDQLEANVGKLRQLQSQLKISDALFVRRYLRGISNKTWVDRLKPGDFTQVSERMAERVGQIVAGLNVGAPGELEEFTAALPFAREMASRVDLLRGQRTDRRCLVVLAPTGVGKSWWARYDVRQHPEDTVLLEMRPAWRNKPLHILQGLSRILGAAVEGDAAKQLESVIANLCTAPKLIYFDEGHEGGLALLKLIKSLINESPAAFVYLAYPSEWDKMLRATDGAYDEAKQLVGRSIKPIFQAYRAGVSEDDVECWLRKVAGMAANTRAIARSIAPLIRHNYGLRTLSDALADARAEADEADGEPADFIVSAVEALCGASVRGKAEL